MLQNPTYGYLKRNALANAVQNPTPKPDHVPVQCAPVPGYTIDNKNQKKMRARAVNQS